MAEVEYKYDPETEQYRLIEVNTRHWDQHQLSEASGIDLSWVAYCHLTGKRLPHANGRVLPATWIAEDALLMRLIRSVIHPELRTANLRKKLSGPRMYGIFSASDPLPFCHYFLATVFPTVTGKLLSGLRDCLRSTS